MDANNPNLTGWPIWRDSQGFQEAADHPYVYKGAWEAPIVGLDTAWLGGHLDFMRKEPSGRFYLRRALQDDVAGTERAPSPNTALDFGLTILRTAEAIAVGKSFASALVTDPETTILEFAFRWKGLAGRYLSSWANPGRSLSYRRIAKQDEITCLVAVPLDTSPDAISTYTKEAIASLFALFEGFEIADKVVDDLVGKLLERKL